MSIATSAQHTAAPPPTSPGDSLADILEERQMDQKELAMRLGVSPKHINQVISAKSALTADIALGLESVLQVPAEFWLRREANYRAALAKRANILSDEEAVAWVRSFPYLDMAKHGFVAQISQRGKTGVHKKTTELLRFFRIHRPAQWEQIWLSPEVAFRRSLHGLAKPHATSAWLRAGELAAADLECAPYDADKFRVAVRSARVLALRPDIGAAATELQATMAAAGVALILIPMLPGTGISGATHWLNNSLAILQLSLRYRTEDSFWFTFAHEAAHILLHGKRDVFLEGAKGEDEQKEEEANRWAGNFWVPTKKRQAFERRGDVSEVAIRAFAQELAVPVGIVVGQLQHSGYLPYTHLNGLKRKLVFRNGNDER